MIDKNRSANIYEITCDRCPSGSAEVDCDFGWRNMIEVIKNDGWKIIRIDDGADFEDVCPDCVQAEKDSYDIDKILEEFLR